MIIGRQVSIGVGGDALDIPGYLDARDTHDWDAAQTPILIDGEFNGRPRKMVAQASRNGHYFLLDRATGEHLVTSKFIDSLNWTTGINAKGQPAHDPAKDASVPGTLVSP